MDKLRDQLLQQDGPDAAEVTEEELCEFRVLLVQEQKRVRRIAWFLTIPYYWLGPLLGLIVIESLLERLVIPFVTAFGVVVLAIWIGVVPWARRLGTRLEQSRKRVATLEEKLPEHADKQAWGIPLVARYEETRFVFWPGVLLVTLLICVIAVIVGNGIWWALTGTFSRSCTVWQTGFAVVMVGFVIRQSLIGPISNLKALASPDWRFWIPMPRIGCAPMPRILGRTCVAGMLGLIGILSVYLFFEGNNVYARAVDAFEQAQTIRALGYAFEAGQRVKHSEIRYQAGRGTHIQWLRDKQVIDMYDDGQFRYSHVQGNDYAVKKKTQKSLLPRELTEAVRYLKWSRRDPSRDRQVRGAMYRCYRRQDANTRVLMWIDWKSGAPRFRVYEEYRRVQSRWQLEELVEVDYDLPMDLVMPPAVFEAQGVRVVEPEKVLEAQYSLDNAVASTEVLGLTFAVHAFKRWQDYLFVTCSVRPTEQSRQMLREAGYPERLPWPMTYGGFNLSSWWQRNPDGSMESRPYNLVEFGQLRQDGVDLRWYALRAAETWPGQGETYELCAYVRAQSELAKLRQDQGLEVRKNLRPVLSLKVPQAEVSIEQLSAHYQDLAPMVVEIRQASQLLFVREAKAMTRAQFLLHLETLLKGLHPMQELWDERGSDLNIELLDPQGAPVAGALVGRNIRRTDQGPYQWRDRKGHTLDPLVSNELGQVLLPGTLLFGPKSPRKSLACIYAFHEQKNLAALQRIAQEAFGSPLRIHMQPACRVRASLERLKSLGDESSEFEVKVRLESSVRIAESRSLLVNGLTYTTRSGKFEALVPPGEYRLAAYSGSRTTRIVAHKHFTVPTGKRDLDLGVLELTSR